MTCPAHKTFSTPVPGTCPASHMMYTGPAPCAHTLCREILWGFYLSCIANEEESLSNVQRPLGPWYEDIYRSMSTIWAEHVG
ncbi:hypothetical protein GDO81_015178 [Engystomops pustulosus]|uniref:Uncharacterized protein n=1 Tax=Engystomops pustulosus TaxID=76066 RepID=A0AAV7ANA5_ENGPU|nr:hypothetical protein GDO81_015178 [Engystomops pustulosus]